MKFSSWFATWDEFRVFAWFMGPAGATVDGCGEMKRRFELSEVSFYTRLFPFVQKTALLFFSIYNTELHQLRWFFYRFTRMIYKVRLKRSFRREKFPRWVSNFVRVLSGYQDARNSAIRREFFPLLWCSIESYWMLEEMWSIFLFVCSLLSWNFNCVLFWKFDRKLSPEYDFENYSQNTNIYSIFSKVFEWNKRKLVQINK